MSDEYFNPGGDAAQDYERLLGQRVVIYYNDPRGNSRKIVGNLTEVVGNLLWFENVNRRNGQLWRGALNCAHNDITMVSTVEGWSDEFKETHSHLKS